MSAELNVTGLFEAYGGELRCFLLRRVRCPELAADLAQETFLRVMRMTDLQQVNDPRGFLYSFIVVVRVCCAEAHPHGRRTNAGRRRHTRRHNLQLIEDLDVPSGIAKNGDAIGELVTLYKNLSGIENLAYFAELASGGKQRPRAELLQTLKQAGLPDGAADKRVGAYSKGMRQKVGIAIAMIKNAKALLLDEPTSGLDPKASNEFSALLTHLSQSGMAILMVTHDLFRAEETGTRIGIMRAGQLRQTLATSEIGHADLEWLYLEHMRD